MPLPGPLTPSSFPEGFDSLAELAFDLRSAWNHRADALWESLDAELWRETGSPWLVLQSASRERLRELWSTPSFRELANNLREASRTIHAAGRPILPRRERAAGAAARHVGAVTDPALRGIAGRVGVPWRTPSPA
jgi:hypothetical protein